jgi:hypothetical protein
VNERKREEESKQMVVELQNLIVFLDENFALVRVWSPCCASALVSMGSYLCMCHGSLYPQVTPTRRFVKQGKVKLALSITPPGKNGTKRALSDTHRSFLSPCSVSGQEGNDTLQRLDHAGQPDGQKVPGKRFDRIAGSDLVGPARRR